MTEDEKDFAQFVWDTLLNEQPEYLLELSRCAIIDAIVTRVARMSRDAELRRAYEDMQALVQKISPDWRVANAINSEMRVRYEKGETFEKILCGAMRRLQDGMLFNRWIGN